MYEERLCAFVDILEFRELVGQSVYRPQIAQKLLQILQRHVIQATPVWERNSPVSIIKSRYERNGVPQNDAARLAQQRVDQYKREERGSVFSDSLILSAVVNDRAVGSLIASLLFLSRGLAELGIYVRGGICLGKLHHDADICFGPGLIAAYDQEKKIAIYPRIIFERDAQRVLARLQLPSMGELSDYFREDFDGEAFLDFLSEKALSLSGDFRSEQMLEIRRKLCRQMSSFQSTSLGVKPKLHWFARYFNLVLGEAPIDGVSQLDIEKEFKD